jgi:hypothetical protein
MDKNEIKKFIEIFSEQNSKTMVIVDFANVEKWKGSLGWKIGIQELANLVKNFSKGDRNLRIKEGIISNILYIEDFEYRLNMDRFKYK